MRWIVGLALFGLVGCANLGAVKVALTPINNPISMNDLEAIESTAVVAFAGLNAYKKVCVQGAIPASCFGVIAKLQTYTRRVPPILVSLRRFVKNNDQVNAITAYNTLKDLIAQFRAVAQANNVVTQ